MKRETIYRALTLFYLVFSFAYSHAQPPQYLWGKGITAFNTGSVYHVAMDKAPGLDRIVQVGRFTDSLEIDNTNWQSEGGMFIVYSDTNKNVLWVKKEGQDYHTNIFGYSCPSPLDVEMLPDGSVVVLGTLCADSTNLINNTPITHNGYFLVRYNSSGVFQWMKTYRIKSGTYLSGTVEVSNFSVSSNPMIFASFTYGDTLTTGTTTLSGPSTNSNAALLAYDLAGNEQWAANLPGQFVVPKDMVSMYGAQLFLLVDYQSLNTSLGNFTNTNSAVINVDVRNGNYKDLLELANFIGSTGQYFESNAVDFSGSMSRLMLCGRYHGKVAIGNDTLNTTSSSIDRDVWVASIDSDLVATSFVWARGLNAPGQDYANDVIVLGYDLIVAGSSGLGGGHIGNDSIGVGNYLASFDELGNALWTLQQPQGYQAYIHTIKHGGSGPQRMYVGGGVAWEGLFGNDHIDNPAKFINTVSQVSFLAKTGPPVNCIGFAAVAASGDTLISCQAPQQLIATHSLAGSPNYSVAWSPAQYLDNSNSTVANVTKHVDMQTFTFTATDNTNGCVYKDSLVVGVYLPHAETIYLCPGDTAYLDLGPGASMYDWVNLPFAGPTAQVAWVDTPGTFWGVATYTAPINCGSLTSTFTVIDSCIALPDDVWPGDANTDGIADLYDVLNIGIGYNISGPVRTNATTVWVGQPAQDWNLAFLNGTNLKHADCDGNGHIDSLDVDVVALNYGLTHPKTGGSQRRPGNPPIAVDFTVDTTNAPGLVTANILLGDATNPVTDGYGVAFSLGFDNTLVDSSSIEVDFTNSWLGNGGSPQSLTKNLFSQGKLDIAHTRTTHTSLSGSGQICSVSFYIQDNIIGKDLAAYHFGLEISGSRLISDDETEILLDEVSDSVLVLDEFVGINETQGPQFNIYPNPTSGQVHISLHSTESATVTVCSALGGLVLETQTGGSHTLTLDLADKPTGIYFIKVQNSKGTFTQRLVKH